MNDVDERIARGIERLVDPADPTGVLEDLRRRRSHRVARRRARKGLLVAAVLAGTGLGVWGLVRVFPAGGPSESGTSAGNGLIAVARSTDSMTPGIPPSFDIVTVRPDGTGITNLTPDGAEYYNPAWSPDGRELAFRRTERTKGGLEDGIFVMNADGSGLHEVYARGGGENVQQIEWSREGTRIGFIGLEIPPGGGSEADFTDRLFVMNADGTDVRALTPATEQVTSFSWSPDGTRIAFTRQTPVGEQFLAYDIWVMDADGTDPRPLTSDGVSQHPAWSPDGTRIAFESARPGLDPGEAARHLDIYVMNADGTGRSRLTDDPVPDAEPSWSPDGTLILFGRYGDGHRCSLLTVQPDGSDQRTILTGEDLGGCPSSPSWQPVPAAGEGGGTPRQPLASIGP